MKKNTKGYTSVELMLGIAVLLFVAATGGISIYGLILAFSASVIIGFAFLFISPAAFVTGLIKIIAGIDLAQRLAESLGLV